MTVPAMPTELATREVTVEAVLAQVRHAQEAARRVDADLTAQRAAERIVDGLLEDTTREERRDQADALFPLEVFRTALTEAWPEVFPAGRITRGLALDAIDIGRDRGARAAAFVLDRDLDACGPQDAARFIRTTRVALVAAGVDVPEPMTPAEAAARLRGASPSASIGEFAEAVNVLAEHHRVGATS